MPARIEAVQSVLIDYDGKKTESAKTTVTVACDGPRCGKGESVCPGTVSWVAEHPETATPIVKRLINVSYFSGEKFTFLTRRCQHDHDLVYAFKDDTNSVDVPAVQPIAGPNSSGALASSEAEGIAGT